MGEARHTKAHWERTHRRWFKVRHRRPEDPAYREEWYAEQCGMCEFWIPLAGSWGLDYGACSNPSSPFDGAVRFEHDGCEEFSPGKAWGIPEDFAPES
jgi:hypothetical protein